RRASSPGHRRATQFRRVLQGAHRPPRKPPSNSRPSADTVIWGRRPACHGLQRVRRPVRQPRPETLYLEIMHVQYVALCDQVILAVDGKPSLIGIFSDVQVPELPVRHPRMSFVARVLFTADETGKEHKVEVQITDPAGNEIGRPGGDVQLPP